MEKALRPLPLEKGPYLLVGTETADDAGVYQLSESMALVQTVDFITPIVDDPFLFGQIAAANSLSDVYAMGGKPLTALNIVGFPRRSLDIAVLSEILRGGLEKVHEAGALLLGGHTVDDTELKYGLAVTGTVHPRKVVTNSGIRAGDVLILTKALGTGVISTAGKAELADSGSLQGAAASMARLNERAAQAMAAVEAHACTDVTGFGLLGHACEMAKGSRVSLRLNFSSLPFLPGAKGFAAQGLVPGGAYCNEEHFGREAIISYRVPEAEAILLFDPQTSGGLLIAVAAAEGEKLLTLLAEKGIEEASIIGEALPEREKRIYVE